MEAALVGTALTLFNCAIILPKTNESQGLFRSRALPPLNRRLRMSLLSLPVDRNLGLHNYANANVWYRSIVIHSRARY